MTEQDELLLLRALLRAADYGVLLSDPRRQDILCNPRFLELFGVPEQIIHLPPDAGRALIRHRLKDPDEFERTLEVAYADPTLTCEDEFEFLLPHHKYYRRYTAPVRDEQGEIVGRLWTFLDVTRTKLLERKVRDQAVQLQAQARQLASRLHKVENVLSEAQRQLLDKEKMSMVGLLAASVAHDIRNILTPLTIELTLADQDKPKDRREALEAMRRQVDRLSLLTHRLLAVARPGAETRKPVALGDFLNRIADLVRRQAALITVTVTVRIARRLPLLCADEAQLDQVLINLALNALQAMEAQNGGTLTLEARVIGSGVALQVSDTGLGIAPSVRRRMFDPFFSTKPDGAGLGLYSCRGIIEAHGGTIKVRSAAGRGTRFTVWLPESTVPCHGQGEGEDHGREDTNR